MCFLYDLLLWLYTSPLTVFVWSKWKKSKKTGIYGGGKKRTKTNSKSTYCIDGGQGEGEVEVVAVVDVSVLHEL